MRPCDIAATIREVHAERRARGKDAGLRLMGAVLGTNVIMSAVFFGGVPLDVLSAWHGKKCSRKVYGKESLSEAEWVYPTNSLHRFFEVTVEMP